MRVGKKILAITGLLVVSPTPAALAKPLQETTARATAIHECNVRASPYVLYTWGNWQLYVYRACMAMRHQAE